MTTVNEADSVWEVMGKWNEVVGLGYTGLFVGVNNCVLVCIWTRLRLFEHVGSSCNVNVTVTNSADCFNLFWEMLNETEGDLF